MASLFFRTSDNCLRLTVLICIISGYRIFAALPRFEHRTKGDGSLRFLVLGDWGRKGFYNQSEVAFQMGRIGEKLDIDFVISTGDNFYEEGLEGVEDSAFVQSFKNIYTAKSLQKQWYLVLGNHDYRGDVEAQLSPVLRIIDNRWLCMRSYVVDAGIAEFFFIDTTPFVDEYFTDVSETYDWRGVLPQRRYVHNLKRDLELALKNSTANWKIVVGHHTIRSAGYHGETKELIQHILPILKANNVDLYMNGHDHCLQHIPSLDSSLQYLTSGGGSKAWRGDDVDKDYHKMKFFYRGQGFMSVQITESDAQLVFYDVFGQVLHQWKVSKQLNFAA